MSFVRTLVLLVVALGLGAYLYFVEEPKALLEKNADMLLDFDPADVAKLRLAYPEGSEIVVTKEDGAWKLTAPVVYAADGSAVENFLTTVKETKIERRLKKDEAGDLRNYGLDGERGSQARLELTMKDGKALPAVVLGIATPVGYQAFARKEGSDEVDVIPLLLQSSVKKTPFDLRSKSLFDAVDTGAVQKVSIHEPDGDIELERSGDVSWTMRSPLADSGDSESIRSMLDSIATIDALAFYDGEQADRSAFGLGDGATRFEATMKDGSKVAFTLGKEATDQPAGYYFERASDHQVAKVPDWAVKKFAPPADELRQKRLLDCKAEEIRSMTWEVAGMPPFTISREAAGTPWSISPAAEGEVLNQGIVNNAVGGLVLARASDIAGDVKSDADLAVYGLDRPLARLDVKGEGGKNCAALVAAADASADAKPGGRSYFLKDAARSAVMRASEHEYSRVAMKRAEFVDAAKKAGVAGAPAAAPAAGIESPAAAGDGDGGDDEH